MKEVTIEGVVYEAPLCIVCGVRMLVAKEVRDHQRRVGGFSFCSNGHQMGFRSEDCEEERIRRERDQLKQQNARLTQEAKDAAYLMMEVEAESKRQKARSAAGVCSCCKRTFRQLAAHMKTKHGVTQ